MKKKFILSIFCCFTILLVATGCDKNVQILQTESDVYSYLKDKYPNETFKIMSVEESDEYIEDACDKDKKANVWTVYSESSQETFEIYDTYTFNSFTCNYGVKDNYKK